MLTHRGIHFCTRVASTHPLANASITPFSSFRRHYARRCSVAKVPQAQRTMQDEKVQAAEPRRNRKPVITQKMMAERCRKDWLHALSSPGKPQESSCSSELGNSVCAPLEDEYAEEDELAQDLATLGGAISSLEEIPIRSGSCCVLGIDPDVCGALAVLRTEEATTAEVYDVPSVQIMIGKKKRLRHDARAIVELINQVKAPFGSFAYIEQNMPMPQNGKQGWWGSGFGFGIWIGILVASGFTVVPVPSNVWKQTLGVAGKSRDKNDSRDVASLMFPLLSSELQRKKDHGRAEALLIAAFGKGISAPLQKKTEEEETILIESS